MFDLEFKFYLGFAYKSTFNAAIITNINSLYKGLTDSATILEENEGLCKTSLIELRGIKFLLIKVSPGNVIVDILKLLKDKVKYISLLGLAGTLKSNYKIGEIVSPGICYDELCDTQIKNENFENSVKICQTSGLVQTSEFYYNLLKKNITLVDMESLYIAKYCNEAGIVYRIISLVSDNPFTNPFYEVRHNTIIDIDKIIDLICEGDLYL